MPDAAFILRRTLAERQLIGGEVQKPPKKSLIRGPVVANESVTRAPDTPLGLIQTRRATMDKMRLFPLC